jgi:pimeloyl-ACP methyl ester carboxylesterase
VRKNLSSPPRYWTTRGLAVLTVTVIAALVVGYLVGYAAYSPLLESIQAKVSGRLPIEWHEHSVKTPGGISIYVAEKRPAGYEPSGVVLLLHWVKTSHVVWDYGSGEYNFMNYLAGRGLAVYAVDLRGYGKSSKPNGTTVRGETCAKDLKTVVEFIKRREGRSRISLVGLSFGTVVAVSYAGMYPGDVDRLVLLSYPYKSVNPASRPIVEKLIKLAESGVDYIPWTPVKPLLYTYDAKVLEEFSALSKADTPKIPTGPFLDLVDYPASKYVPGIKAPTLLVYGDHDTFCDPQDEMNAFKDLGAEEKAIVIVGNASHGLVLEKLAHKQVYSLVYDWLTRG